MNMDDFTIGAEDIAAIEDGVRRFVQTEVKPHLEAWEEAGEFPRALYQRTADLGWLAMGYPERFGGTPAPWSQRNAMTIALARHGGSGGLMASLFSHNATTLACHPWCATAAPPCNSR
jgi:acyl-CoA dehydrogenase